MASRRLRARSAMRRSPSSLLPDSPSARTSALPQMTPSAPQARIWRACEWSRVTKWSTSFCHFGWLLSQSKCA